VPGWVQGGARWVQGGVGMGGVRGGVRYRGYGPGVLQGPVFRLLEALGPVLGLIEAI